MAATDVTVTGTLTDLTITDGTHTVEANADGVAAIQTALNGLATASDTFTVARAADASITITVAGVAVVLTYVGAYELAKKLKTANHL